MKENREYFGPFKDYFIFDMKSSKFINYWTVVCWSCPHFTTAHPDKSLVGLVCAFSNLLGKYPSYKV
jgi:hypothetical protein